MVKNLILIIVLFVFGAHGKQCGTNSLNTSESAELRIVGGRNAVKSAWPWQIELFLYYEFHCGGSVIDKEWVLTAAHCLEISNNPSDYMVRVGEHDRSVIEGSEIDFTISKLIIHEGYNRITNDNDVALLKLSSPIDLDSDHVNTVCLPSSDSCSFEGQMCVTTGWGLTSEHGSSSDILREVFVPVIPQQDCIEDYDGMYPVTKRMICTGYEGGKGVCYGDSGGPLVCKIGSQWQLIGVTSWGYHCATAEYPSVYARVTQFRSWIDRKILTN